MTRSPKARKDPSEVTADDLIARAEAKLSYRLRVAVRYLTGRPLRRYPRPSSAPPVVAILLTGAMCFVGIAWYITSQPIAPAPQPWSPSRPDAPALPSPVDRIDSRRQLEDLSVAVTETAGSAAPAITRVQVWQAGMSGHPDGYVAREELRRFDADGTSHLRVTALPPQHAGYLVAIAPADARAEATSDLRPAGFPSGVGAIAVELSKRSTRVLWGVAQVYRTGSLSADQRADIYRVLAGSNVVGHGAVSDRFGRPGLAFTFTHEGIRDLIIADAGTGELLAFEQYDVTDPGESVCLIYLAFFNPR